MHIKTVAIQGFKSFNERTIVGPFHRGHNVVVGRNGSGKSNFFAAIEFVLSDEFSNLRVEQRSSLLHEGNGPRPISAFVEIVFDNADRRFPIDSDEVTIKRCIGAKKDQFYLNSKLASNKSEVVGILETAGFSYSNPYYIVKQGQINAIACCDDKDRLKVVREVAGTVVYTEKRKKAEDDLAATDIVVNQVSDSLRMVAERLGQLGEEKEMLEQFRSEDKKRRTLEFAIIDRDMKDVRLKLRDVDEKVHLNEEEASCDRRKYDQMSRELEEDENKLLTLKDQHTVLMQKLNEMGRTNEELTRAKEALVLRVNDYDVETALSGNEHVRLDSMQEETARVTELLEKKRDEIKVLLGRIQEVKERMVLLEQDRNRMFASKGRKEQFSSREERDEWIRDEIGSIEEKLEMKNIQVIEMSKDLKVSQEKLLEDEATLRRRKEEQDELGEQIQKESSNRNSLAIKKAETDRKLRDLIETCNQMKEGKYNLEKDEQNLAVKLKTIPGMKQILVGHDSIMKVLRSSEKLSNGYYGMVINLFSCAEQLYTAIDETAGNKLFYHVVEDDQIATALMGELNKRKLPGIFNLLPLNRIRSREFDYSMLDQDAFPLIQKIQYDMEFHGIMNFVFGNTIVCRNMDIVVKLAKTSKLDCITLDGEKGSSKGVLSGGYISLERSKMANYDKYQAAVGKLGDHATQLEFNEDKLAKLQQESNCVSNDIQKLENSLARNENSLSSVMVDVKSLEDDCEYLRKKCGEDELSVANMRSDGKLMKAEVDGLRREIREEMNSQFTSREEKRLESLIRNIEDSKGSFKSLSKARDELLREESILEAELLGLKKDEENTRIYWETKHLKEGMLVKDQLKLENISSQLQILRENLASQGAMEVQVHEELRNLQISNEKMEKEVKHLKALLDKEGERKAIILDKKIHLQSVLKKLEAKVNSLGGVQPEMLIKFKDISRKQLGKELQRTNKKLKKYENVNRKALDQFVTFTEENERLRDRLGQLSEDKTSIMHMINVLDNKKSEQIFYTYKQLYKNFKKMFTRVVEGGKGELVLTGVEDDGLSEAEKMENATGLSVSVSFTGNEAMKNLNQLSGGQKSVVALVFILAIQECDPAPFYLFDEVDAALDVEHRRAIAAVIHSQARNAQFITTTFRPEMLRNADQCLGVVFRGKASHVELVSSQDATSFVQDGNIHN